MNEMDEIAKRHTKAYHILHKEKKELNICVDVCEPDSYLYHAWEECIGSGTAYLYITGEKNYASQIITHLKDVHDNLGFKRIYFDKINAYEPYITTYSEDNNGSGIYKWDQVDAVYDIVLGIGLKPFVMISAMPKALASDPGNTAFDGGNSSAPKDYKKWKEYCKHFIGHLIERYSYKEVSTWYVQIFNEPDIGSFYWSGTHEEFFMTYDYAATGIKEVCEGIKVGPGGFAFIHGHLLAAFIDHVTSFNYDPEGNPSGAPIDFINGHGYFKRSFRDEFERLDKYMVSHFGPNHKKELIISEWNAGWTPHIRDSAYNAAYIVKQVIGCSADFFSDPDKTRFFSFWTHSDIFDEMGEIRSEFPDYYGLITRSGIRKAGYNAFKMLHRLGNSRIRITGGDDMIDGISTYNNSEIVVLLYNYLHDELRACGDKSFDRHINLRVSNVPWPKVKIEHFRIDNEHSNSFQAWREIGSPDSCTEEQLAFLIGRMDLEMLIQPYEYEVDEGVVKTSFMLPMPAVSMLCIQPVQKEFIRPQRKKTADMHDMINFIMGQDTYSTPPEV